MKGWLVNDYLTILPGVRTLWHDLRDWFEMVDCTGVDYPGLADSIERKAKEEGPPDYIIRNGSYFRPLLLDVPTLSFFQDPTEQPQHRMAQVAVMALSLPVFASRYMSERYPDVHHLPYKIIPTATDFSYWTRQPRDESLGVLPNSIAFIAAPWEIKGWTFFTYLVENTPFNYVWISKVPVTWSHPRCKIFIQEPRERVRAILSQCVAGVCTSRMEAGHVTGQEMAAVGLPIVSTPVANYFGRPDGVWGHKARYPEFITKLHHLMNNLGAYSPRQYWMAEGFDIPETREKWQKAIKQVISVGRCGDGESVQHA